MKNAFFEFIINVNWLSQCHARLLFQIPINLTRCLLAALCPSFDNIDTDASGNSPCRVSRHVIHTSRLAHPPYRKSEAGGSHCHSAVIFPINSPFLYS